MKRKFLLSIVVAGLMLTTVFSINAENLVIQKMDKSETKMALETIGRLEFDHPQRLMFLILKDGTVAETYSIDEVHKFYFSDAEGLEDVYSDVNVRIENNRLIIDDLPESSVLRIFSINGQLILQQTGNSVSVETLNNGVYLLQCNQGIVKFIKN